MSNVSERRTSRRFTMTLPLSVKTEGDEGAAALRGETRDVSFRGLYFMIDSALEPGAPIEFVLTLPKEITLAGDVLPEVAEIAGAITPVPGGVGPLTITMLMVNTVQAAKARRGMAVAA